MGKRILKFLFFIIGIALCAIATVILFTSGDFVSAVFNGCVFIVLCTIAGLIFGMIINPVIAAYIARHIFWNSGKVNSLTPEFSKIRAKIANGEYSNAEKELRDMLKEDNGNPHIVALLAELFIDKTKQIHKAEGLLRAYLSKEDRNDDDLKFVMMLTDIYLDSGRKETAMELLISEKEKKYSKSCLKSIVNRIKAITT